MTGIIGDHDGPWDFTDSSCDHAQIPYTDRDSEQIADHAVVTLILLRAPMRLGDAGPAISVLISLTAETENKLYDAVADARDQGYTWEQIASRLATTATTARRRYSAYTRWRNTVCLATSTHDEQL